MEKRSDMSDTLKSAATQEEISGKLQEKQLDNTTISAADDPAWPTANTSTSPAMQSTEVQKGERDTSRFKKQRGKPKWYNKLLKILPV